ncbi:MAG: response regulator, partial [Planctomycetes bacterium]|nr:response regulator [Planctomycetota bacterium]
KVDRERVVRWLGVEYPVSQAGSAVVGCELVKRLRPACVLLDYHLPDASGLELVSELRADGAEIVLMTGQGSERAAVRAIKLGCIDYLVKSDLTEGDLRGVVERAVRLAQDKERMRESDRGLGRVLSLAKGELVPALESSVRMCEQLVERSGERGDESATMLRDLQRASAYLARLVDYATWVPEGTRVRCDIRAIVQEATREVRMPEHVTLDLADLPVVCGSESAYREAFRLLLSYIRDSSGADLSRVFASATHRAGYWIVRIEEKSSVVRDSEIRLPTPSDDHGWDFAKAEKILANQGGAIRVEHLEGGGNAFVLSLPEG